jgi:hypothetical protein
VQQDAHSKITAFRRLGRVSKMPQNDQCRKMISIAIVTIVQRALLQQDA